MKLIAIAFLLSISVLSATTYHLDIGSLGGVADDANPGSADKPWKSAMKAFTCARQGDTVIFRKGVYRLPRTLLTSDFRLDADAKLPFIFKAMSGEEVVITVLKPVPAASWQAIAVTKSGHSIFAAPSGEDGRVTNLTEDGVPLTRAPTDDPRYPHRDSLPEAISGPGEWASSLRDHRVMVCTRNGKPPGDRIEVCDVRGGDGAGNLIDLQRTPDDRCRSLRIVFEGLTLETGFYGITIRTGAVELRQCTLRKSFGDLINTLSGRLLVEDCDFSAFGESAIDVTGPGDAPLPPGTPPMSIRRCKFHHNAQVRGTPKVKGYNGVMLKGGCADIVVEGCEFHDLHITISALGLGGSTGGLSRGGPVREGIKLAARDNVFRRITGPASVVVFEHSEDCLFSGNRITDCDAGGLISVEGKKEDNLRPLIRDNALRTNRVSGVVVKDSP